jgi:hypothetical protein
MKKLYTIAMMLFVITLQGQNKLLSSIQESYNGSSWQNYSGYNYEYDGNNNLITETYVEWVNGLWKIKEKVTYTYDANNKVVQELGQEWNATTNALENSYRDKFTYTNGNFTGQVAEIWENSIWVNEWKIDLTFNGNNLPVSLLSYNWVGANWVADERGKFTYNSNNKLTEELYEESGNSPWVNSSKSLYAYNLNHQMVSSRNATWDDFNNLYKEFYRTDYVLDGAGNRSSETDTDVNNNNKWKDEYTYDSSSLMSNFAHPFKDKNGLDYLTEDFPYVNKILAINRYSYNVATGDYNLSSKTTYNYNSALTLAVENTEMVNASITLFPNPTTSVINLDFSEAVTIDKIVVVDITGKTVLQQAANTTQVNVEKLAKGLYILEAYSGKEKFTSKFIKE